MNNENKIKKIIRLILFESIGKQITLHDAIPGLTENLIDNINSHSNKHNVFDGKFYEIISRVQFVENSREETAINYITIDVNFSTSTPQKITGSFIKNKTKLGEEGFYDVFIEITLNTGGENLNDLKKRIGSVIVHELNHAFVHIKKIKNYSKTQVYNKSNKMTITAFNNIPALKEFSNMFYLNLPEEIQARVQETGYILEQIDNNNYNDAVRELYLYPPINDAKKMSHYRIDNIKTIDRDVLRRFVNMFNFDVDRNNIEGIKIRRIDDVDKFFEYWIDFINENGNKLNHKILKLVAEKFNKNDKLEKRKEIGHFVSLPAIEEGLLDEIFGFPF